MKQSALVVAGMVGFAILSGCNEIDDSDIVNISIAEVRSLRDDAVKDPRALLLIDARAKKYYEQGHLPGAVNYELYQFPENGDKRESVDAFDEKVVYGDDPGSPEASGLTKRLMALKYKDVRLFRGGFSEWKASGLPVESGAGASSPPVR